MTKRNFKDQGMQDAYESVLIGKIGAIFDKETHAVCHRCARGLPLLVNPGDGERWHRLGNGRLAECEANQLLDLRHKVLDAVRETEEAQELERRDHETYLDMMKNKVHDE